MRKSSRWHRKLHIFYTIKEIANKLSGAQSQFALVKFCQTRAGNHSNGNSNIYFVTHICFSSSLFLAICTIFNIESGNFFEASTFGACMTILFKFPLYWCVRACGYIAYK